MGISIRTAQDLLAKQTKRNWKEFIIRFVIAATGNAIMWIGVGADIAFAINIGIQEDGIRTSISKFHKGSIC